MRNLINSSEEIFIKSLFSQEIQMKFQRNNLKRRRQQEIQAIVIKLKDSQKVDLRFVVDATGSMAPYMK